MGGWGFQLIRRCVRVAVLQVAGRDGEADALAGRPTVMQRVVLSGGHAATLSPLAVLVNHQSASASEILAGGAPTPLYFMLLIDHHMYPRVQRLTTTEVHRGAFAIAAFSPYHELAN